MNLLRLATLAALVPIAACSKLTVANYDTLATGMSLAEVQQVLGPPAKCDETVGLRQCTWGDEQRQITVNFAADRLILRAARGIP
jgi:hypothetical protein